MEVFRETCKGFGDFGDRDLGGNDRFSLGRTEGSGERWFAQHFVCNTGYTIAQCQRDVAVLRRAMEKYPVAELGEWTWVLVRSSDWTCDSDSARAGSKQSRVHILPVEGDVH